MEKITQLEQISSFKNYLQLTKPGIIMGNIVTAIGGFILASRGHVQLSLFLATLLGLTCIIASACVCNNYIDRELDKKMARTRHRVLAQGLVAKSNALLFSLLLGALGTTILLVFTTPLTTTVSLFGLVVYVTLYSFSKYFTPLCTLIGSIAGAVPPVVGYTAVTHQLDLCALLLFLTIAMWQMPHFFSIALYRLEDYKTAEIPILPVKNGILATKVQMVFYIIAFIMTSALLTLYQYTGLAYLIVTTTLGGVWLVGSIQGFFAKDETKWARIMFIFSLVIVMSLCITMCFSTP